MMFFTHLLFGIISGYAVGSFLGYTNLFLFVAVAAFAAIVPDIDILTSKISRKLPPFAVAASSLFGHRGLVHSIWPPLLLYAFMAPLSPEIAAAVVTGYLSHLLLDSLTKKGIAPFYPLPLRIRGFIKTNGIAEKLLLLSIIAALLSALLR